MSAILQDPELRFRAMQAADVTAVHTIEQAAHVSPWSSGIFNDCIRVSYLCIVLERYHEIIGYAIMNVAAGEAHLFNLCVSPSWQRRGYGRVILERMLDMARERGAKSMFLEVRPSNGGAIALYEDSGFVEVGLRKGYYPAKNNIREDAIILAREL